MTRQPTISVIIPVLNSAFLSETIDAVLAQTFKNFELIIVDCSTNDSCRRVIESFEDSRIKAFYRLGQCLPGDNRNFGIERASSELIICLDADDLIAPTFLEEALFVIVCTNYSLIGTSIRLIGAMNKTMKLWSHPTLEQIAHGDAFVVTILFRKSLWEQLGGFHDHALGKEHVPEDWDFFLRALADGATLYNRGSYGFLYRKHYDSITAQPDMPSFEEMRVRMRERHKERLVNPKAAAAPELSLTGWQSLAPQFERQPARLLILPEQINDHFWQCTRAWLAQSQAPLIVLSTCEIESYPAEFLHSLHLNECLSFSLPDFLEDRALWLPFIEYLDRTRQIEQVCYGQNFFFIDHLEEISTFISSAKFQFIPRYSSTATNTSEQPTAQVQK